MKGERIRVSTGLGGVNCTIQTDDGMVIHGARVSEEYVRAGESEGVFWGRCVHTRSLDRESGQVVFEGEEQQTKKEGGSLKWITSGDLVTEIEDAEPPPLRPSIRRG